MTSGNQSVSIMVVDGSALCRKFYAAAIGRTPGALLAGVAPNLAIARQKICSRSVDLILLGLGLTEGLSSIQALRRDYPRIDILLVGVGQADKAHLAVRAMQAGAFHFLPRPDRLDQAETVADFSRQLLPLLRHYAIQRNVRQTAPVPRLSTVQMAPPGTPAILGDRSVPAPEKIGLIVIAVSTGGPIALSTMIPSLADDLGIPVLVVQHMPAVFTAALAETLNAKSKLTVKEGVEAEPVVANTVYLAPGGRQMSVRQVNGAAGLRIALTDDPPVKSCRPSADLLFASVAAEFHGQVLAVVMTGMGDDGVEGVRRLKCGSCYCLAQSQRTCVVYGMPRAVELNGLADESVDLEALAARINQLVKG